MTSRIEALVLNILGEKEELFNPQSRIEEILYSILQDTAYIKNPLSRIEAILLAIKNSDEYTRNALSRVEEILLAFKNGTNDYDKIPQSDIERDLIRFLGEWVTKSGSIVSYDTDQVTPPLRKLEVKMEPIQDLNGYDSPWPGGGGKNLVPSTLDNLVLRNTSGTWNNNVYTLNGLTFTVNSDGSIKINGTATATTYITFIQNNAGVPMGAGDYITHKTGQSGVSMTAVKNGSYWMSASTTNATGSLAETANIAFYMSISNNTVVDNLTVYPMVEKGSTATAYAPYSNICPISGWTGAKVTRTGRNLIELSFNQVNVSNILSNVFEMKAGTYTLSFNYNGTPTWGVYLRNGTTASSPVIKQAYNGNNLTFTLDKDYQELCISVYYANGISVSEVTNAQIEKGSAATAYEPYQGETYDIEFPISAGTVYGGTLDVVTGELVVDGIKGTFSGVASDIFPNWYVHKPSGWSDGRFVLRLKKPHVSYGDNSKIDPFAKSSHFKLSNFNTVNAQNTIGYIWATQGTWDTALICYVPGLGTVDEYLNWFANNPTEFYYKLATPITTQLTPTEVRSLLGQNNIWSDAGDVTVCYHS